MGKSGHRLMQTKNAEQLQGLRSNKAKGTGNADSSLAGIPETSMNVDVYCDNTFPDLFTSSNPQAKYLLIGSLWLPVGLREELKDQIKAIRERHNTWGEIKWSKISRLRLGFYIDLIDLFMSYDEEELRFRGIAVDREQMKHDPNHGRTELGIYMFYYEMLQRWTNGRDFYRVFCPTDKCIHRFKRVLLEAKINTNIQALPSKEVALIQLTDLLIGAASSRANSTLNDGTAKEDVAKALEQRLGKVLGPTIRVNTKFNLVASDSQ